MSTILCIWDLGDNIGHLVNLKPSIDVLIEQGHDVYLASKDLHSVSKVFNNDILKLIQAPVKPQSSPNNSKFLSLTHIFKYQILDTDCTNVIKAWRLLFELVNPDLVLFENSVLALIAAVPYYFKKVIIGNGFAVPPINELEPFGIFFDTPRDTKTIQDLFSEDQIVLDKINSFIPDTHRLNTIGGLYSVDNQFLMTLPCLDHFRERETTYLGFLEPSIYKKHKWDNTGSPKVFVYLNNLISMERLLYCLKVKNYNVVIYIKNCQDVLRERYTTSKMIFIDNLVDLQDISTNVDFVITHGNHNTTMQFVLAGVPQLLIPYHQEHLYLALRLKNFGSALVSYQDQPTYITELNLMETKKSLKERALELRDKYTNITDTKKYISETFNKMFAIDCKI